ncbi:MAG: hypothetical protein ABNH00_03610 [Dokdonia sp.]|jgi:hypothetical protein
MTCLDCNAFDCGVPLRSPIGREPRELGLLLRSSYGGEFRGSVNTQNSLRT